MSGAAWAVGGKAVQLAAGLAISALLTRLLHPGDVGAFFLGLNAVVVLSIIGSLGLEEVALQQIPPLRVADRIGELASLVRRMGQWLLLASAALALMYGLALHPIVFQGFPPDVKTGAVRVALGLWVVVLAAQRYLGETFRGFNQIRESVLFGGTMQFGGVGAHVGFLATLGAVLLLRLRFGLAAAFLSAALPAALVTLVGVGLLHAKTRRADGEFATPPRLAGFLPLGMPLLLASLAQYFTKRTDIWVAGASLPPDLTGLYAAVAVIPALINVPLTNANLVVAPAIGELMAAGATERLRRLVGITAGLAFLPAVVLVALFALLGGPILGLLFGSYYSAGGHLLIVLCFGSMASVIAGSNGFLLLMAGRQVDLMACTIIGAIVSLIGCVIGVRLFGVIGLAGGAALGTTVGEGAKLVMARIRTGIWSHARPFMALSALRMEVESYLARR